MAPPSRLAIATSSVVRLVKEEGSYKKEQAQQEERIKRLEKDGGDENAEYEMRQELKALEETKAIFPNLRQKIADAVAQLEQQLESTEGGSEEEIANAKDALAQGKGKA